MVNIFSSIPENINNEIFEDIVNGKNVRIERIVSYGHSSPESGWYDQVENEWVIVLKGSGSLLFENGDKIVLSQGDYLNIPAHAKHKVIWTSPYEATIWLAVFYN
jgi:cupin 2 domain-containing protein